MANPFRWLVRIFGRGLARFGVIDAERSDRATDLAWPRMLTGLARTSQKVVDFAMLGAVLGPPALAGVGFAFAFWRIGSTVGLGLAGGTIGYVSQSYGDGDEDRLDRTIKSSGWLAVALAAPLALLFVSIPETLIRPLARDPQVTAYGATYLRIAAIGMGLEFLNKVVSRVLVGAEDAWTPMVVRGTGAVLNIVLNAIFIFGLGLGVAGAALGTLFATVVITIVFAWGFATGSLPGVGQFPVRIRLARPFIDWSLTKEIAVTSAPLVVRRTAQTLGRFPLLAIAAVFGPVIVVGYEVSRRIRSLLRTPNWGFKTAASSLVGQHLGRGESTEADRYGWDLLWFSLSVHIAFAAVVLVFARPLANVFVDEPSAIAATTPFVRVAAISVIGACVEGVTNGVLLGSGDTRWPMYGKVLGLYVFGIPIAYSGTVTSLGVVGLYLALIFQTTVPAVVSTYRFQSDAWKLVGRSSSTAESD